MERSVSLVIRGAAQPGEVLAVRPMNFGQACSGRDIHPYALSVDVETAIAILADDYLALRQDILEHRDADEVWEKEVPAFSDLRTFVAGSVNPAGFFQFMAHDLLLRLESGMTGKPHYVANTVDSVVLEADRLVVSGRAYPWSGD